MRYMQFGDVKNRYFGVVPPQGFANLRRRMRMLDYSDASDYVG
jgi:hypothetical protein